MSKFQEISGDLLAIANLPPEKRNSALSDLSVIIQGWADYEMVQEQKDLISSIIKDLIAENDAEQIAKSKLVFVEDVEEQIAPTKKTRAKKVVKPVKESTLEDLPDTIKPEELLDNLPDQVLKLAILRNKQDGQNSIDLDRTLMSAFNWGNTPEAYAFWNNIHTNGDLTEFKKLYGNKGEKVDEIIEFAELNEFVEGLSQPVAEAPAVKTRKPRTPKVAPVVAPVVSKQEVKYVELIFYPPSGGALRLKVENPTELLTIVISILNKLNVNKLKINFSAIADGDSYTTQVELNSYDSNETILSKLVEQYDTFVKPELDWSKFGNRGTDIDRLQLNEEILLDSFPKIKPVPVVAPKPVKVVAPKVVTPKPAPVVAPKVVAPKVVAPKVVAPKVVKTKVTKPKVEDDLSFLDDLNNIF
jgi:hypothetical protein